MSANISEISGVNGALRNTLQTLQNSEVLYSDAVKILDEAKSFASTTKKIAAFTVVLTFLNVALWFVSRWIKNRENAARESEDPRFFHTRIHEAGANHSCKNEVSLVHKFGHVLNPNISTKFAQGIFSFKRSEIVPQKLQDPVDITISFIYKNKVFFVQFESLDHENLDVFVLNMPLRERLVVEVSLNKTVLKSISFQANRERGYYQYRDASFDYFSLDIIPISPLCSIANETSIDQRLYFHIERNGKSDINRTEPHDQHYFFHNETTDIYLITLQLRNTNHAWSCQDQSVSMPIVVRPGEKKGISKEILDKSWRGAYSDHEIPKPPNIQLYLIQYDILKV